MLQTNYGYVSQRGVPGGLYDSSPHSIVSRANGAAGVINFGFGVVQGDTPGVNVDLPTSSSTAAQFEGIVMTSVAELDMQGNLAINPTKTLGILDWGKAWVRVVDGLTIAYGDSVYLVNSGADAGRFTNASGGIAIKARFISAVDSGDIAVVELYNTPKV